LKRLILVLADAGIELVPQSIWRHSAVRASAAKRGKKPGEILLDVSLHHHAMLKLKDREKRGRPDITHVCLLVALSSLLNRMGFLEVYIHTYQKKWIRVSSETRIPRNYNRFVGLMEQLLLRGRVPPDSSQPLMEVLPVSLREGLRQAGATKIVVLSEKGRPLTPRELARSLVAEQRPAVIVGAFQRGQLSSEVLSVADDVISIAPLSLDAWTVVSKIISSVEDELGVYEAVQHANRKP